MIDPEDARMLLRLRQTVTEAFVLSALSYTPRRWRDIVYRRATINVLLTRLTRERLDC